MKEMETHVTLEAKVSQVSVHSDFEGATRTISYACKMARRQTLRDPVSKRNLNDVPWSLELHDTSSEIDPKRPERYGTVIYSKECEDHEHYMEEQFIVWALVPSSVFEMLLTARENNSLPTFTLGVYGLAFGWEPDGSSKEWELSGPESRELKNLQFTFASPEPEMAATEEEPYPTYSPTAAPIPSAPPVSLTVVYWLLAAILLVLLLK